MEAAVGAEVDVGERNGSGDDVGGTGSNVSDTSAAPEETHDAKLVLAASSMKFKVTWIFICVPYNSPFNSFHEYNTG